MLNNGQHLKFLRLVIFSTLTNLLLLSYTAKSNEPELVTSFHITAPASDLLIHGDYIIASTGIGTVDIYNYNNGILQKQIRLPDIVDFQGDYFAPSISAVDYCDGR